MPSNKNLKVMQFEKQPTEVEMAIQEMANSLPLFVESAKISAKVLKTKFDNLISEGFNEQQAMEIIKTRPLYE